MNEAFTIYATFTDGNPRPFNDPCIAPDHLVCPEKWIRYVNVFRHPLEYMRYEDKGEADDNVRGNIDRAAYRINIKWKPRPRDIYLKRGFFVPPSFKGKPV